MKGQVTVPPWELAKPKRPKLALLDPDLRTGLWRRSGGFDEVTGERIAGPFDVHHRVKKSQGRDDRPRNLLVVSRRTHDMLGKREAWAREHGFVVSGFGTDPGDVAVLLHCQRYVLLTDGLEYVDCESGDVA